MLGVLRDSEWTEWLPIYSWLIDHPEGPILVDTGETSRTSDPSYFPRWHPYYRWAVEMDVPPEAEIGPQLRGLGVEPGTVPKVLLTHLHTDHAGGLHHFPNAEIYASREEISSASGLMGRLQGYLPNRWPTWFDPKSIPFSADPIGAFETGFPITAAGDVWAVPTPGHTPGHISVLVRIEGLHFLLAGDTTYSQGNLLEGVSDGVSPRPSVTLRSIRTILRHAARQPTVYLPSHDPGSEDRLAAGSVLPTSPAEARTGLSP
jgi:glyoxylase-like metal-dependent hydrolase (beta-lactamase superfamily II)